MLFTSVEFAIFLPVMFFLYWFVVGKNLKVQNSVLLAASYFFYGWWDWRFLGLLFAISLVNYLVGLGLGESTLPGRRKLLLITGLIVNIGSLCFFKYFNFFVDSFIDFTSLFGLTFKRSALEIILPLGISFYIFLSLSYIIDIYKKNLAADKNIINVFLTLSFFPIILAGPIQRPSTLLPQISRKRTFDYGLASEGLKQILWGAFTKVVIADRIGPTVNSIFGNYSGYSGSTLLIGALLYTVQIYADFSGYSNIAIGTAKLFGFNLMRNFAYPYFSRDITEFWKRWHISLTTWFRDYIFLPISFSISSRIKGDKVIFIKSEFFIYIAASIITWLLTGLWHGANYTFIIWGLIHGTFLILFYLQKKPRKKLFKKIGIDNNNSVVVFVESVITLMIVITAWIFFRSDSIHSAAIYINHIFSASLFTMPEAIQLKVVLVVLVFIVAEWIQRNKEHALHLDSIKYRWIRWSIYYVLVIAILKSVSYQQQFIYFQF